MEEVKDIIWKVALKHNDSGETSIDRLARLIIEGLDDGGYEVVKKLNIPVVTQAKRPVCPDCFDRGELRNDKEEITGTCPCHY